MKDKGKNREKEVHYSDGATPLFLAIEETDFRQALDIVEADPEQVRTWVRSTGTENTTFTWSQWRRLPIHEACRRQAPAWLVSSLFSVFPESAYFATHFGELPLHLAVESGAAPEVVNLILVANWGAIVCQDNSGRLPTDILDQGESLLLDDHRIVHESLTRCFKTYTDIQQKFQESHAIMESKHKGQIETLNLKHQEELRTEHEKHENLMTDIQNKNMEIERMKKIDVEKDNILRDAHHEKLSWRDEIISLKQTIAQLQNDLSDEKQKYCQLKEELEERDDDVAGRDEFIECLATDLKNISTTHEHEIAQTMIATEKAMRAMISSQMLLQDKLSTHQRGLKSLLKLRGIESLGGSSTAGTGLVDQEEKETFHDEEPADSGEVASVLAAAAMEALEPSKSC